MRVLITGGHLTPALATIHAFQRHAPDTTFVFIGREFSQEKEQMLAREKDEVEKLGIPFYPVIAAKFHRTYLSRNFKELMRVYPSFQQIVKIIKQTKPDVFLSFGGYLAVPVAIAAKLSNIPVITHEQTKSAGLANQVIAKIADIVAISYEESKRFFPKKKIIFTGNPIRPAFVKLTRNKPSWFQFEKNAQLIVVTGGSQGSHIINKTFSEIVGEVTEKYQVVHQCGRALGSSYFKELQKIRERLPSYQKKRYSPREWISEDDMSWLFRHASLVISRAGANTVQEVMASGVPAIFIPLPFAHNNEQAKNAQELVDAGSAVILQQKNLLPQTLFEQIRTCMRRSVSMKKKAAQMQKEVVLDAADQLVRSCMHAYAVSSKKKLSV